MNRCPLLNFLKGLLILVLLASCGNRYKKADSSVIFRYNEAADITSLDPAFARDQASIWAVNQLFNGLVQLNDRLEVIPCIASRWDISPDGRKYTFHLRDDVRFHDNPCFPAGKGRRATARDFVYSFQRILDPRTASPGVWVFNGLYGADPFDAPDDSTLVIRLKEPFPPFLGILTMLYCSVIPREAVIRYGVEFRRNPVGTGPFCMALWKEGVKLVLARNPFYFEVENGVRLPFLEAVSITFLPDKQSAFLEFMKGNLDFMSGIDPSYKDELLNRDGSLKDKYAGRIRLVTGPYLNTEYLGILVDPAAPVMNENPLRLRKVRQALNLSFDRRKMVRYLRNNIGKPGVYGIIPVGLPGSDTSCVFYDYNPAMAQKLLSEEGFPGGKGLPPLVLTSTPDYLDLCKYIQFQVAELGIRMNIEISPPAAVKEMKALARLPFFRASWIADYPDAESYLSLFLTANFCPQGPNYTHFSNARYDALYRKAMQTLDDSSRFETYREMDRIMMAESPVIVLYYDQVLRFAGNEVKGLGINPMNLLMLKRTRKN